MQRGIPAVITPVRCGGRHDLTLLDETEIAKLGKADGVWFVGGDQSRISATLKTKDGGDAPFLAHLRARWREGVAIGGSSAGAAMMSGPMIVAGDSPAALVLPVGAPEGDAVVGSGDGALVGTNEGDLVVGAGDGTLLGETVGSRVGSDVGLGWTSTSVILETSRSSKASSAPAAAA